MSLLFFFFFSSRRRHTRWNCDWSSDVCSSDLHVADVPGRHHPGTGEINYSNIFRKLAELRSEEHTSELQSQFHLVCRLLLEKKKKKKKTSDITTTPNKISYCKSSFNTKLICYT